MSPTCGDLHAADQKDGAASSQLEFVALLSSVGEEVFTAELGSEEGLLHVESESVEVVDVGEWTALQGEPDANLISAGLVTLDTNAISPGTQTGPTGHGKKRRASTHTGRGGKTAKGRSSQESTINLQDLQ